MSYNKIISIFKKNTTLLLFFLSTSLTTHILANNPNEAETSSWKSKIFTSVDNVSIINILDLDNKIEIDIVKNHKILLNTKLFTDETISIYELTNCHKLPEVSGSQNSQKDSYLLFFFKKTIVYTNNAYIKIGKAIYPTKFSTFHEVFVHDINTDNAITGMLSFINYNSLIMKEISNFPLDCKLEKDLNNICLLDKLIKAGSRSARQTRLQSIIEHENILNSKQLAEDSNILPIPQLTFLTNFKINEKNHTIDTILSYMYDLSSAVAYLHDNNIAHGNISIMNLFILNNKLVLAGFEYFSKFEETNDNILRVKTIRFPGNMHYPPEFKNPIDNNECGYGYASFKGDIWSLGLVLVTMLYKYYQYNIYHKINELEIGNKLNDYNCQQTISSTYVVPYKIKPMFSICKKLQDNIARFGMLLSSNTKSSRSDDSFNQILEELIIIINKCHNKDPNLRPTATEIKNKLSFLIDNHSSSTQVHEPNDEMTSML